MSKKSIRERVQTVPANRTERWKELVGRKLCFPIDTSYAGEEFRHVALTHESECARRS